MVLLQNLVLRLAIHSMVAMDEQKLTVCEEMMKIQIAFFEELGMQKIADHCVRIMDFFRFDASIAEYICLETQSSAKLENDVFCVTSKSRTALIRPIIPSWIRSSFSPPNRYVQR